MGSGCFAIQLWWEIHPWFVRVVPMIESCLAGGSRGREEGDESPCADSCNSQRGRVVQVEV